MTIDLYYHPASAPCRPVVMTAKLLGLKLNLHPMNLMAGDHLKPEFIKMNPQHTIPTLDDNGFHVCESRAITGYLVAKYGKDDSLYPKDINKRTLVDQRLYFDAACLAPRWSEYFYPQILKKTPGDPEKLKKVEEALGFLNTFLEGENWVAGGNWTIADLAIQATVNTITVAVPDITFENLPNVKAWLEKVNKASPDEGVEALRELLKTVK